MMPALFLVLAAAPLSPALLSAAQCEARHCTFVEELSAGRAGRVVHLSLPTSDAYSRPCEPQEWWLVGAGKAAPVLILRACNDGYGAAGMGEDMVTVSGTRLTHARSGGSNWRWGSTRTVELSPPGLVSEQHVSFHTSTPNRQTTRDFDWRAFTFTTTVALPGCGPSGVAVEGGEVPLTDVASHDIPQVALPVAFREGGWKTTPLGSCSASGSFSISGAPGPASDASLRVVSAPPDELYVEVTDDRFLDNEAKWLFGDHLELWLPRANSLPSDFDRCLGKRGAGAWQWAIDLNEKARVTPAAGAPGVKLEAQVVREGNVARAKLKLPPGDWYAVTVVFSDSDDGKAQKQLISTSQLRFNQAATLGGFRPLQPRQAACEVGPAGLSPRSGQQVTAAEPILSEVF